jgi:hypothetical protein
MEGARERAASIAILTSIPMVAQLIGGRAVRDALFLTEYDAVLLPRVMLAAAAFSLGAAISVGRLMPLWGPRATAVVLALLNGAAFVLEAALLDMAPGTIAVVTYLHVSVVGALVVSAFSSVVNERFDPLYAKTVVAQVGTGAALGGVLGGVAALFLADTFELGTVLYGLGGISVLVALGVWNIGKSTQSRRPSDGARKFGIQTIGKNAYLRSVALTVVLLGAVGVLVDYGMKAEADARLATSADLLSFFATFYMMTSSLTFVMQAGVAKPLLQKIGLGGTMAVLPLAVALSAGLGAVWTRLWTVTLVRGTQTVVSSSLFRSGYELLYTPVPPLKKRATKAIIDIACNRIGYGLGSLVVMAIVAATATADIATSWVLAVATIVALISAWMIRRLQDGYVQELATSVREGVVVLKLSNLMSGEPEPVLNALLDESLNPRLAAYVIDLLGNDLFAQSAYQALEHMCPRVTGQLVDAMLWTGNPVRVRRRIPRLLRKIEDPRAAAGLLAGLRDEEFEVRYRCGHALADMQRADRSLDLPERTIMEAVERELAADQERWQQRLLRDEISPDIQSEIDALLEARDDRSLQHVFTLLSLARDRDAIILSLRALSSQDANLRGTALEYLHNILPEGVRESLWPKLTERSERPRAGSATSSPEELLQSMRLLMPGPGRAGK